MEIFSNSWFLVMIAGLIVSYVDSASLKFDGFYRFAVSVFFWFSYWLLIDIAMDLNK